MEQLAQDINQSELLIEAKNISHKFDYPLFSNINLTLQKQESIAIIGSSGCGKSTFLNILSTLLKPESGEIIYDKKKLYSLNDDKLLKIRRDQFGIIFQSHYLFRGFNAKENLDIASLISEQEIDKQLLKELNIDFVMDQNIGELSGGQQQRLSIARVLTKKPEIIFADEPTGNLDKDTANEVMDQLLKYVKENNAGLMIVTHEDSIAYRCDHVYKFNEKRLEKLK